MPSVWAACSFVSPAKNRSFTSSAARASLSCNFSSASLRASRSNCGPPLYRQPMKMRSSVILRTMRNRCTWKRLTTATSQQTLPRNQSNLTVPSSLNVQNANPSSAFEEAGHTCARIAIRNLPFSEIRRLYFNVNKGHSRTEHRSCTIERRYAQSPRWHLLDRVLSTGRASPGLLSTPAPDSQ